MRLSQGSIGDGVGEEVEFRQEAAADFSVLISSSLLHQENPGSDNTEDLSDLTELTESEDERCHGRGKHLGPRALDPRGHASCRSISCSKSDWLDSNGAEDLSDLSELTESEDERCRKRAKRLGVEALDTWRCVLIGAAFLAANLISFKPPFHFSARGENSASKPSRTARSSS